MGKTMKDNLEDSACETGVVERQEQPPLQLVPDTEGTYRLVIRMAEATEAFGTDDPAQISALAAQLLHATTANERDAEVRGSDEFAAMTGVVADIAPTDAVERMLAVQMAATHVATMRTARWLAKADMLQQVETHNAGLNKLARTFAAQMEALRKHRTGGKQTVVVQHVNVEGGGQAIVGNVQTGGGHE